MGDLADLRLDGDPHDIKGFVWVAWHLKGAIPRDQWMQMSREERDDVKAVLSARITAHNRQMSLDFEGHRDAIE